MSALTKNAMAVLKSRYLLKDSRGRITETPEEMFRRVAIAVASAEKKYSKGKGIKKWEERFYEVMSSLLFLPNSPTLMNAGTQNGQLSACFVLPVKDSTDGIFRTLHDAALIQKSGGGTGFNFSHLRPENDWVADTGSKASGPLSFMKIFDEATEHIRQGGKRRGANMGVLSVSHPDIIKFIRAKQVEKSLKNFNISVLIPDSFMQAVQKNESWSLINPRTGKTVKKVNALKLWKEMILFAHQTGDPGILFYNAINKKNPTPALGKIETTNPCGEVPLLDYEPCNLGSINLSKMVTEQNIRWELLEQTVFTAIRFLDNVIDVNNYILPEIEKMAKGNRKIGLGVMGWADLLIQLEIPYASAAAVNLGGKVMQFIQEKSLEASMQLAKERGPFPNWKKSIFYPKTPLRNATRTSIAPTGTISIIAGVSPSIEPLFALFFRRKHVLTNKTLMESNPYFPVWMKRTGGLPVRTVEKIRRTGSLKEIKGVPPEIRKIFLTAHEIHYRYHIDHQLAFQKYTDNAVSKTINMKGSAKRKDVRSAFMYAWKYGAKGITVFRDGSKKQQVLNRGKRTIEPESPDCVSCITYKATGKIKK